MPLGRIGGLLILAGLVTFAGAVILAISGNAVGLGARGVGGLLVLTTLGLLGVGCGALALHGAAPVSGQAVRAGLVITAVGMLAVLVTAIVGVLSDKGALRDVWEIVLFIGGGVLTCVGLIVLAIAVPVRFVMQRRRTGK